jgi:uncharacterized protein
MQNLFQQLAKELNIALSQVEKTVALIDEGNTIPFIARYRKEVTGQLSDVQLRDLNDRLTYLRQMQARREEVSRLIEEVGAMTPEIQVAIDKSEKLSQLEDIYRPFKPKRRTRATMAKEKGLEPLSVAMASASHSETLQELARTFVNEELGVLTVEEALQGAMDILSEFYADDASLRDFYRQNYMSQAIFSAQLSKEGDAEGTYTMYHDYREPALKMPPHRVLAVNRGERENVLKLKLELDHDKLIEDANRYFFKKQEVNHYVDLSFQDAYKRLIEPSLSRELRTQLTEQAEEHAISVFGINLKQLLLQPPLKNRVVMGFDPAYRTGCKVVVLDEMGRVLAYETIYPTKPHMQIEKSEKVLLDFVERFKVDVIAIGNGTGSRESEQFIADMLKKTSRSVYFMIVNEAGASVYSASELANEEYPEMDVTVRGAISIGARVQDPLSELVKIDPKSIGVGQYQHDVNQKRLSDVLDGVVEDAVNSVGVDVNTASESLLQYIAGITKKTAKNLVAFRNEQGGIKSRKEILKVKGIGQAAFNQAAGFLRVVTSENPLDHTGVHPESYDACMKMLEILEIDSMSIGRGTTNAYEKGQAYGLKRLSTDLGIHVIVLEDLLKEIDKPGRDPRDEMAPPILRSDVLTLEDLAVGMELKGTVRNVVDFGAFVDIGVKQDGLVHISELSNRFVKRPMDVVQVGDVVDVRVLGVDLKRQKVSLSMKR